MLTVEELRARWQGAVIPVVTPFKEDRSIDFAALENNIAWLMDKGARTGNSIFLAAGSGGDFTSMNLEERKQVIRVVSDTVAGRAPVMAGAQSNDVRECIEICQLCETLGVDAAQISAPYYYDGRPGDALAWFQEIARHTDAGFAVYNNWYTGYDMPFTLIEEVLGIRNSIALKWGAPNAFVFTEGILRFNTRVVVVMNGGLPEIAYPLGVKNHVSHLPNFYPEHSWRVHDLFMAGKNAEAQGEWYRCILPWRRMIAPIRAATGGEGVFVRPGMEAAGLNGGHSRLPSRDEVITPELRRQYRDFLALCAAGA